MTGPQGADGVSPARLVGGRRGFGVKLRLAALERSKTTDNRIRRVIINCDRGLRLSNVIIALLEKV